MDIKDHRILGGKVAELMKLDIFKNTRKREFVEARALVVYLLRAKLFMRWIHIAKYFNENGKSMDHSTCIHLYKMYPNYKFYNEKLSTLEKFFTFKNKNNYDEIDRFHYLETKIADLQDENYNLRVEIKDLQHTRNMSSSSYISEIYENATAEQRQQIRERITLLHKSWSWKSKDHCEIIESSTGISGSSF
jgi:hypothetical protein